MPDDIVEIVAEHHSQHHGMMRHTKGDELYARSLLRLLAERGCVRTSPVIKYLGKGIRVAGYDISPLLPEEKP